MLGKVDSFGLPFYGFFFFAQSIQQASVSIYQRYGSELNNAAYGVFTMTNDLEKLAKALKWSKRAMEIYEALSPDENHTQNRHHADDPFYLSQISAY